MLSWPLISPTDLPRRCVALRVSIDIVFMGLVYNNDNIRLFGITLEPVCSRG